MEDGELGRRGGKRKRRKKINWRLEKIQENDNGKRRKKEERRK